MSSIRFHGVVQNRLQQILAANLKIGFGQRRLLEQALVFQIGGAHLRGSLIAPHRVAYAAEKIGRPGNVQRRIEFRDGCRRCWSFRRASVLVLRYYQGLRTTSIA